MSFIPNGFATWLFCDGHVSGPLSDERPLKEALFGRDRIVFPDADPAEVNIRHAFRGDRESIRLLERDT